MAHGEVLEFEEYVRTRQDALLRSARRLVPDPVDAQDLLQDALIEAFRAFPKFRIGTHFARWVMRIMTHTYIDRTRRRTSAPRSPRTRNQGSQATAQTPALLAHARTSSFEPSETRG